MPSPPGGPQQQPCPSTPRNFRKHLRMVGSRRVKAQSKAQSEANGWAVLLLADCGLACCSLRPQPSHTQAPPKGQGPAPSRRLRPCPPTLPGPPFAPLLPVPLQRHPAPSRPRRPASCPAADPSHLPWLQATSLTGSALTAAFAERRERSFSRSWSDPTPMKADTSHDSRDSRCPAPQAGPPSPEAPLGPQPHASSTQTARLLRFRWTSVYWAEGGALTPPVFWVGVTKGQGSLATLPGAPNAGNLQYLISPWPRRQAHRAGADTCTSAPTGLALGPTAFPARQPPAGGSSPACPQLGSLTCPGFLTGLEGPLGHGLLALSPAHLWGCSQGGSYSRWSSARWHVLPSR